MSHSLSAAKRMRQNAKSRARNRANKAEIKSVVRQFREAVAGGDAGKSGEALHKAIKTLDKNAAKGTIHKKTASRRKSRLTKRLNALKTGSASA